MSIAELESNQKNLLHSSIRARMRIIPNSNSNSTEQTASPGAVAGLFTYYSTHAESDIEILRPLGIGETFTVSATITDIVRKSGKRAGTFDIVTVAMSAEDSAGTTVALLTNSYVFPRREA